MSLVEKTEPPGYTEWAARARELVSKNKEQFRVASGRVDGSEARTVRLGDRVFVVGAKHAAGDVREEEWDGEEDEGPELEGIRTPAEREDQVIWAERKPLEDHEKIEWEEEPQLTAEQYVLFVLFAPPKLWSFGRRALLTVGSNANDFVVIGSKNWRPRLVLASLRRSSRLPRASSSSSRPWSRPRCKF